MNDDYLWDKSGEPDPQIQQLEEILGTLRYQQKPLKLPEAVRPRRNYFPLLAIAAAVVIAVLAGALWLQLRKQVASIPAVAIAQPQAPIIGPALSVSSVSRDTPGKRTARLVRYDKKEALAAKQQLMFALRLASEKLNAAHRRTQDKRSSYENTLPN
jgi:negative regulator of sigma E activity